MEGFWEEQYWLTFQAFLEIERRHDDLFCWKKNYMESLRKRSANNQSNRTKQYASNRAYYKRIVQKARQWDRMHSEGLQ